LSAEQPSPLHPGKPAKTKGGSPIRSWRGLRDPVSGFTHLAAALLSLLAAFPLLSRSPDDTPRRISLIIFALSQTALYGISAAYHLMAHSTSRAVLPRLDHSFAFILIAGTYTPICYIVLDGPWRWGLLITIWTLAAAGVLFKVFFIHTHPRYATALYVLAGWIVVLAMGELIPRLPTTAIVLAFTGGITYTVGATIYALQRPNPIPGVFGFHELWHLFVIGGSLAFFFMIYLYVAPYPLG